MMLLPLCHTHNLDTTMLPLCHAYNLDTMLLLLRHAHSLDAVLLLLRHVHNLDTMLLLLRHAHIHNTMLLLLLCKFEGPTLPAKYTAHPSVNYHISACAAVAADVDAMQRMVK